MQLLFYMALWGFENITKSQDMFYKDKDASSTLFSAQP
jgi:hypothetical protein